MIFIKSAKDKVFTFLRRSFKQEPAVIKRFGLAAVLYSTDEDFFSLEGASDAHLKICSKSEGSNNARPANSCVGARRLVSTMR